VDTPPPSAVDEQSLAATVARAWSIQLDDIRYVPKGVGSYHWEAHRDGRPAYFITLDDLDTKPWIGRDRDSTFDGLTAAYTTAWVLRHDDGIDAVIAPIRCDNGAITVRLPDQFSVAVFPFVDGQPGNWGDPIDSDDRTRLLHELAELHAAHHGRRSGIRHLPHVLPEKDTLLSALGDLDRAWSGGQFAEPARHALLDTEWRVRESLARFDDLAARLDGARREPVVTHGEPHPGNLIRHRYALLMIDWDTVALAEPERDLWMIAEGDDALEAYTQATGRNVDPTAIEYYRLAWTLSDIASFAGMFRSDHTHTRWIERKWAGFVGLLEGESSRPYGPS